MFDPYLPLSAQPFYSREVLCGHCKETEASLGMVCVKCEVVSFCSKECMEADVKHRKFCLRLAKLNRKYEEALAENNLPKESTPQQVVRPVSPLKMLTIFFSQLEHLKDQKQKGGEMIQILASLQDDLAERLIRYYRHCKQGKTLQLALEHKKTCITFSDCRHNEVLFIMLALNKDAEAVAFIKASLDERYDWNSKPRPQIEEEESEEDEDDEDGYYKVTHCV